MEQQEIDSLLEKYQEGTASPAEIDALHSWYRQMGYADGIYPDEEALVRDRIHDRLMAAIDPVKKLRLWPRVAVAAAVVAAVVFGMWFFNTSRHLEGSVATRDLLVNDIAPGKNGATITLANGKVIELSDAKSGVVIGGALKYSDGSDVRYSSGSRSSGSLKGSQSSTGPVGVHSLTPSELQGANGKAQNLIAATAKGQTYQFTLSDGTRVWLNADSKLEFPSSFVNSKARNVKLSGEGYFEVSKDKTHPFTVESTGQKVTVLGTHFNINAYKDERNIRTTLLEGSVSVNSTLLIPNQQAILTGDVVKVTQVDPADAVAWKDGSFSFTNEALESIMRKVARWYNVKVIYKDDVKDKTFSGAVSRFEKVSTLLKMLETTGRIRFEISGNEITVKKK